MGGLQSKPADSAAEKTHSPSVAKKKNNSSILSILPPKIINGPLAGKAAIIEKIPGKEYDATHGFLNRRDQINLSMCSRRFFSYLAHERYEWILRKFLHCVAYGKQNKAEELLIISTEWLMATGSFTDYSGRKFNCTAYEYAYWARDVRMCQMLETHMDQAAKALMLIRCNAMKRTGLTYEQHGELKTSTAFSFRPLVKAYQTYIERYGRFQSGEVGSDAVKDAWIAVGAAQRDLPTHVINEYCHLGRTFGQNVSPDNLELRLTRDSKYYDFTKYGVPNSLFPLSRSRLGIDFAIYRLYNNKLHDSFYWIHAAGIGRNDATSIRTVRAAAYDLAAIRQLDTARKEDLNESLKTLGAPSQKSQPTPWFSSTTW